MAFRNSEGKGGSLNWKSKSIGGYLRLEFRIHGGGFRSGISTGERWECIPWKRLFYWLNQFANKAWTDNTADGRGRQASIDQWCFHMVFTCRGKPTKSGFYIKLQKNMLQNILFFSHESSLINYFVHSMPNMVFDRGYHFKFQTPKAQIQDGGHKNTHTSNTFRVYKGSSQHILMFCTKLGQCKVRPGSGAELFMRRT